MLTKQDTSNLRLFFIFTYLLFWVLLGVTGLLMVLKVPKIFLTIMQNIDAWSPTFIVLIMYKRLFPGVAFKDFLRNSFGSKTKIRDILGALIIQVLALLLAVSVYLIINDKPFNSLTFISIGSVFSTFVITLTAGPIGEELGWRGYALGVFQKKYSPLGAATILGLLWGFWHLPLWFWSGFTGSILLIYIFSFLLSIVSTSILITYFYNKSKNILIAMWIHFWFNFLLRIVNIDLLKLLSYLAVVYFAFVILLVATHKELMMKKPQKDENLAFENLD